METLTSEQYEDLCRNAEILQKDGRGPKLIALNDGLFVKIFRQKRLISSALWKPYAKRFIENTEELNRLGISTVKVIKHSYCSAKKRHLVYYAPLPGTSLREFLSGPADEEKSPVLEKFVLFLANLHDKGIFFRSVHFGNVLVSPDQEHFSLIDVADCRFYSSSLSINKRLRNFKHFLRDRQDLEKLHHYGAHRLLAIYAQESRLSQKEAREFQNLINEFLQDGGFPPTPAG